jgi:hypothetical protein
MRLIEYGYAPRTFVESPWTTAITGSLPVSTTSMTVLCPSAYTHLCQLCEVY